MSKKGTRSSLCTIPECLLVIWNLRCRLLLRILPLVKTMLKIIEGWQINVHVHSQVFFVNLEQLVLLTINLFLRSQITVNNLHLRLVVVLYVGFSVMKSRGSNRFVIMIVYTREKQDKYLVYLLWIASKSRL